MPNLSPREEAQRYNSEQTNAKLKKARSNPANIPEQPLTRIAPAIYYDGRMLIIGDKL